jgi:excisionase family DNA binding protein
MPERCLTVEQAAELLQVSKKQVRRWMKSGELQDEKPVRRKRRNTGDVIKFF